MIKSPVNKTVKLISLSAITLALSACGSSSNDKQSDTISDVDNFPSVIIGQVSKVSTNAITINSHTIPASSAEVEIDGNNATLADIQPGMYLEVETNGSMATEIDYEPLLKGPVNINADTLSIAGTQLNNVQSANLKQGDLLEVSGYSSATNSITVTYQTPINNTHEELELKGSITNLDTQAGTFNLGNLLINYQQAEVEGALNNGQFVEVEGLFNDQQIIANEVDAEQTPHFSDNTQTELEGVITFVNSTQTLITINNQWQVTLNEQTQYEDGTTDHLVTGQEIEIDGQWQQSNSTLLATHIEFESTHTAPTTSQYTFSVSGLVSYTNKTAIINGELFTLTNQTQYEDGLSAATLDGQWLELEGTYTSEQALVSEVEIEDDSTTIDLKGTVALNTNNQASLWGYVSEDNSLAQFEGQFVDLQCQWVNTNQVSACEADD